MGGGLVDRVVGGGEFGIGDLEGCWAPACRCRFEG